MAGIADGADITLVLLDPESGATRHLHTHPAPEQITIQTVRDNGRSIRSIENPFAPKPMWAPGPAGIFFGDGAEYEVHRITETGAERVLYEEERSPPMLTEADRRRFAERYPDIESTTLAAFPSTKPHYTGLLAGPDGWVWLRVRGADDGERWHVHGAAGDQLGTVHLPPRTRLVGISTDALYAVHYDAEDAETLLRFARRGR